jgi:NAD-dependent DNA ligase
MKIKGFGEKTIDLLEITDINDLLDFLSSPSPVLSELMDSKLKRAISSVLENGIELREFIASMSIPLVGDGVARKLKPVNIDEITADLCKECGIGQKATENLLNWINTEWNTKYRDRWSTYLKLESANSQNTEKNGIVVCITGKLDNFKNRSEAQRFLEKHGFTVKSSVTKDVTHLICEDGTQGSSYKKALDRGIAITTIEELINNII